MEIRPLASSPPGPQGLDALAATATAAPAQDAPQFEATPPRLEPAVKLDIGSNGGKARFIQDAETSSMVFQVVDPAYGDVIEQLPSETALRNRAYDSAREARSVQSGTLSRVA